MSHADDRAKFLSLIDAEIDERIGPNADTDRELDIVGKAAGPYTLVAQVRTRPELDDHAIYALDLSIPLDVVPGIDPDPLPVAEVDEETGVVDPDFEPYVTRAERVTDAAGAFFSAVGLASWEPVRDDKSVKAAEKAAADALKAAEPEVEA